MGGEEGVLYSRGITALKIQKIRVTGARVFILDQTI